MVDNSSRLVRDIFVVLDPTRMVQPSLDKAEWIAERNKANLHMYCCVYDTHLAFQHDAQDRARSFAHEWLERLAERPRGKGLEVSIQVESNPDWRDAIATAAAGSDCDIVVKTTSLHGPVSRRLMKTADWTLIRRCSTPVLLINPIHEANTKVVLAAVKLNADDEVHMTLNEQVVDMSHRVAGVLDAELHVVTVYRGDEMFFDRQKFADTCRLPRTHVHAVEGAVHRGIAEVAKTINAGVIILGCADGAGGSKSTEAARFVVDEARGCDFVVLPVS